MRRASLLRPWILFMLSLALACGTPVQPGWAQGGPSAGPGFVPPKAAPEESAPPLLPLPERVPTGLDVESLDKLGNNWRPWVEETAELIADLYEKSESDADQVRAISGLRQRLVTVDVALRDAKYAPIYPQLLDLQGKLTRRLDMFEALRQVLSGPQPSRQAAVALAYQDLRGVADEVQAKLNTIPQGTGWLPYLMLAELQQVAARGTTTPADQEVLATVQQRLSAREELNAEQAQFLSHPMFKRLSESLTKTLHSFPGKEYAPGVGEESPLREPVARLLAAQEEYEQSGSREASARLLAALQDLKALNAPAIDQLRGALTRHYTAPNLQLIATEAFLGPIFEDARCESGGVAECVFEAWVTGCQWTNTKVHVDVKECLDGAKFVLKLDGDVRSHTQGEVPNATVYTRGTAHFHAEKDVVFNGECFQLWSARVGVNASNCTYDAETCLEWLPIARGLARNYALEQAAERKPESDAYARNKIARQVRQRFDKETRDKFADAEQHLHSDLYGPLADINLKPEVIHLSSSEIDITVRERLMAGSELSGGQAPRAVIPGQGFLVQIHQSLLNNGIDRMGIAGERLTKKELDDKLKEKLKAIIKEEESKPVDGRVPPEPAGGIFEADSPPAEPSTAEDNTRLIFDVVDPISFRFEDGAIIMSLRAGLERPGEEEIPTQIISVPLVLTIEGEHFVMTRGTVGVKPAERPRNISEQITRAQIMRKRIEDGIPERQTRKATGEMKPQGKVIPLRATSVTVDDGWLTIAIQ